MKDIGFKKKITNRLPTSILLMVFRKGKSYWIAVRWITGVRAAFYLIASVQPKGLIKIIFGTIAGNRYVLFCSDLFGEDNSQFSCPILSGRKIRRGEACLFPNAFPTIKTTMWQFIVTNISSDWITDSGDDAADGFAVCRDYFSPRRRIESGFKYVSINGTICRQPEAGWSSAFADNCRHKPTNFMQRLLASAQITPLLQMETTYGAIWLLWKKNAKEGFIASTGVISWLTVLRRKAWPENRFYFPGKNIIFWFTEAN